MVLRFAYELLEGNRNWQICSEEEELPLDLDISRTCSNFEDEGAYDVSIVHKVVEAPKGARWKHIREMF